MTKLSVIYEEFKDYITGYDLLSFADDLQDEICKSYLKKAISRFGRICKQDLSFSENDEIVSDLTNEEIQILALWCVFFWATQYVHNSDNFKNILNTKDFSQYSPSELNKSLLSIQNNARLEATSMMNQYSIVNGEVKSLKKR